MGNLSPKAPGEKYEGGKLVTSANKKNVHIACNAIGFPVPVFRYATHRFYLGHCCGDTRDDGGGC